MNKYLVIGVYEDDGAQRYAEVFDADSPAEAEALAHETVLDLLIAGVIQAPDLSVVEVVA